MSPTPPARRFSQHFAATVRWLHTYISMFGFTALLFFSVTGLTLNHTDWFGVGGPRVDELDGQLEPKLLAWESRGDDDAGAAHVNQLGIAEYLRATHSLKGVVSEFRIDEQECEVAYRSPGYQAAATIDRESGHYHLAVERHGVVAIINDLHKGRDSGAVWSVVIDATAILMTVSALTGILLLLYIRRRRNAGLMLAVIGTFVIGAAYYFLVP